MGVVTHPLAANKFLAREAEDGRFPYSMPDGGAVRLDRRRGEMSVLDGSMVQLQFGWCSTSGKRVLLPYPS